MSMFDELICLYPLPDGWNPEGHLFLTQDTPDQGLTRYVLNAYGVVQVEATGEVLPFHGALTFSTGNGCGSAPWGVKTADDQPEWEAEYTALFDHGRLLRIDGRRTLCVPPRPHILRADWDWAGERWRAAHPSPPLCPLPTPLTGTQEEALKTFARAILAHAWDATLDGAQAQELALELGLIEAGTALDDADPALLYHLVGWLKPAAPEAQEGA